MVTFQFIPYHDIEPLGSAKRVNKLLKVVKEDKIVLMEGRLSEQEENDLIEITMEEIGNHFKGIELAVINTEKSDDAGLLKSLKFGVQNMLLGHRAGFTVIGPASLVKKIQKDPNKIEMFMKEGKRRK